jgi:peptidoglycan-associated lipoprotein
MFGVLLLSVLATGACARRPALSGIAAPAPTGAAVAVPAPPIAAVPVMPGAEAPPFAAVTPEAVHAPAVPPVAGAPPSVMPPAAGPPAEAAPAPAPAEPAPVAVAPTREGETAAAVPGPPAVSVERPAPRDFGEAPQLADIHFDFDRYEIRPDDARIMEANAAWLRSNPTALLMIEGHCDERGTNQYNLALGDRRAKAARDFLLAHGIAADRITLISYGEERPACIERNETCWGLNRRAHFLTKAQ